MRAWWFVIVGAMCAACGGSGGTATGWSPPAGCKDTGICHANTDCTQTGQTCVFLSAEDCAGSCVSVSGHSSSCSGSNGSETCVEYVSTSMSPGAGCPTQPTTLLGTVPPGGSCTHGKDCLPACCACSAGEPLLASECSGGKCATAADACTSAQSSCSH